MAKTEYDFNKNKVFVNPYNFIDVDWNNTARADVKENEGNLTGVIKCKLTSVSPLAIPGDIIKRIPLGDDEYHYEYEFMKSPAGKYMIPGSSIRGVIRSVYEAVTNSCFVTANDNTTFTQRAQMRENGRPYLLSFDGDSKQWILEEAEKHLVIIDDNKYRGK